MDNAQLPELLEPNPDRIFDDFPQYNFTQSNLLPEGNTLVSQDIAFYNGPDYGFTGQFKKLFSTIVSIFLSINEEMRRQSEIAPTHGVQFNVFNIPHGTEDFFYWLVTSSEKESHIILIGINTRPFPTKIVTFRSHSNLRGSWLVSLYKDRVGFFKINLFPIPPTVDAITSNLNLAFEFYCRSSHHINFTRAFKLPVNDKLFDHFKVMDFPRYYHGISVSSIQTHSILPKAEPSFLFYLAYYHLLNNTLEKNECRFLDDKALDTGCFRINYKVSNTVSDHNLLLFYWLRLGMPFSYC